MLNRIALVATFGVLFNAAAPAAAQDTIKIGEINSYKAQPAFLEPYKKGWELAVEEVNAAGGVLGKKLQVISRDDNGNPGDAVRVAEELVSREGVALISRHVPLEHGPRGDRLRQAEDRSSSSPPSRSPTRSPGRTATATPSACARTPTCSRRCWCPRRPSCNKKRWVVVYPNYEYGQSAAATFKAMLKKLQPDVEFLPDQATPLGRIEAGAVVQALSDAKPDAIFNVLFGADLSSSCARATRATCSRAARS